MADPTGFTKEFMDEIITTFGKYLNMADLQALLEEAMYEGVRASLGGATSAEALQAVAEHASRLVTRMTEEMQTALAEKVAVGLEQQLGSMETARMIKDGLGLDSVREGRLEKYRQDLMNQGLSGKALEDKVAAEKNQLINERARTIASNEMGRALETGALMQAQDQGKTHKVWITSGDFRVSDECAAAEAEGPIPIDAIFESTGSDAPPGHVNCRCSLGFVADKGGGEVDRATIISQERADALAQAKADYASQQEADKQASE